MNPRIAALLAETPPAEARPGWEVATVLVTVKAYPAIARASGESVCVAGVRLDGDKPEWIRLFPVGFRSLKPNQQFMKYQVVRLRVRRGSTDRRSESFKPDLDSLVLGPAVSTDSGTWHRRWEILEPLVDQATVCGLVGEARNRGQAAPSLALIKPKSVTGVSVEQNPDYDASAAREFDIDLFGEEHEILRAAPLVVRYQYRCSDPQCGGHDQSFIDWESGALARRNIGKGVREAIRLQRQRFHDEIAGPHVDTHFFVGNQHQHPQSFLVLGAFYPRVGTRPQQALDL